MYGSPGPRCARHWPTPADAPDDVVASCRNASTSVVLPAPGLAPREHAGAAPAQRPRERRRAAAPAPARAPTAPPCRRSRTAARPARRASRRCRGSGARARASRRPARGPSSRSRAGQLAVGLERLDLAARRRTARPSACGRAPRAAGRQPTSRRSSATASSGRPSSTSARARASSAWLRRSSSRRTSARANSASARSPNGVPRHSASAAVEQLQRGRGGQPGGRVHAALEAVRVDLLRRDLEPVAGAVADEQRGRRAAVAAGLQVRAQVRHADGERARRDLARHAFPARVQQRVRRHGAARVEQQPREDRALLRAGGRRPGGGAAHLDRAQDAEVHRARHYGSRERRKRAVAVR